jgi:hypothetical protein
LRAEVNASEAVVAYLKKLYKRDGTYKVTSRRVADYFEKNHPEFKRTTVRQTITALKTKGEIIDLDEKVEGVPGAKYFALSSVMDEVTKPAAKEEAKSVEKKIHVPKQSPLTVAANPFDKVNSQLGEILTKLNGLVNGYANIVDNYTAQQALDSGRHNKVTELLEVLVKTVHTTQSDKLSDISIALTEIKELASSHVTVDGDKLADVINARLQNIRFEDSFIYALREEFAPIADMITAHCVSSEPSSPPVENSSDFKEGIKVGIALAVEMGLRVG